MSESNDDHSADDMDADYNDNQRPSLERAQPDLQGNSNSNHSSQPNQHIPNNNNNAKNPISAIDTTTTNGHPPSNNHPNGIGTSTDNGISSHEAQTSGQSSPSKQAPIDPKQSLEPFDWDGLEERFLEKMAECQKREEELGEEFKEWCQVFQAWASTTRQHEEERLHKRLKTRTVWVQNSEQNLEEKRQHYIKVVQAFESALALLGGL
ncbi:MAG: hypothetical protein Q9183_005322 [Haloplaca sp. 2 TL-2023]